MTPRLIPRSLLGVPYRLGRLPLTVFEQRVVQRLADDSVPRLLFDRAVGTYDYLVGQLLADPEVTKRGSDRMARVAALSEAAELDQQAATARAAAKDAARSGQQQAEKKSAQARNRAKDGVQKAARAEREGKQQAAARAREVAATEQAAAEHRKQARIDAAGQQAHAAEELADDRVREAQQHAKDELADATGTREAAAADRADAEQLVELTAAKRRARTQS